MSLNFISPVFMLGLLGVGLPVLVHLLTKRQVTHIKFSAVYLLRSSHKKSIRRSRPNRLLLLLFRCLAVAGLSLSLAHPIFSFTGTGVFLASKPAANVFILDDSYSMRLTVDGKSLFNQAAEYLTDAIGQIPANGAVGLALASAPARRLQGWGADRQTLGQKIESTQASFATTQIGPAVKEALDLLESSPQEIKRIFILTDLAKNGWTEDEFPEIPSRVPPVNINVVDFSPESSGINRAAIQGIEVGQEFLANRRTVRIKAKIANLLPEKRLSRLPVSLWVDGKKIKDRWVDAFSGLSSEVEFSIPLQGGGPLEGRVEIGEDSLNEDNRRYFIYQPEQKLNVLLVDGDPNTVAHQSETFYLERALNPFASSTSDIEPTISTLAELPRRDIRKFSAIILCNVNELPFDYERQIEKFVLQGGGLIVSLGDKVDPGFFNKKLGALFPVTLDALNQVGSGDEPFRMKLKEKTHPALKVFDAKTRQQMEAIRFHSIFSSSPREGKNLSIPISFSNGTPALIESTYGEGKTILFASTLDRDWNEFPIQPTFLPWIQRWVKYAARGLGTIARKDLMVGEAYRWEDEGEPGFVETPTGAFKTFAAADINAPLFKGTAIPGVYKIYSASKNNLKPAPENASTRPDLGASPIGFFTVNLDTEESRPQKISPEKIQKLLAGAAVEIIEPVDSLAAQADDGSFPLAGPFLLLAALALLGEGWLVRRE